MSQVNQETNNVAIDEGLYSRQLYVLGHDAMKRMGSSNILIIGLRGLGVEIAKNIILAGVKSVTLYDPSPVVWEDLSAQFYLSESQLGQPRDKASLPQLTLLNQYVTVSVLEEEPSTSNLNRFQVVVCTETSLQKQLELNNFTHNNDIRFISADIRGLFASVFCDFGSQFQCNDINGENPVSGMIAAISSDKEGVVTCLEETRHNLEDGDYVQFTEVKGMEILNSSEPRKVKYLGPYTFSIGDTTDLGTYVSGGLFNQVKVPVPIQFKSLQESLANPEFVITDFAKFDRPQQLHAAFQALDQFQTQNNGQLPRSYNEEDANRLVELTKQIAQNSSEQFEVDEKLIKQLSYISRGQLSPMAAVIGGLTAQEVLKAVSSKFKPIQQHLYFDSLESLPTTIQVSEASAQPQNNRYDGQTAVFGAEFQNVIANSRHFLVGAGAIGCEMLKNWAMMGLASGQHGSICVTDMDTIEKSNLNRQFLFRPKDVGHLKSDTAAAAVTQMNPDLEGKIISRQDRVGQDTEHIYDEEFFNDLNVITNALDNVEARTYMDRRCVLFRKPLLESGTLGTKGNTQVVIPDLTESYSSSQDPPEKSIPICTLKNFPNAIEHTIQWARDLFEGLFKQEPDNTNQYLTQPDFVDALIKQGGNPRDTLVTIKDALVDHRAQSFQDCVTWARLQFQEYYFNVISQLLFNFPPDAVTSTGTPFWSGPKRVPTPIKFDNNNPLHIDFIIAAANLRAFNFGIAGTRDVNEIKKLIDNVIVPEFVPKAGVKIQVNENEPVNNDSSTGSQELDEIINSLPSAAQLAGLTLIPSEFEKDDDHNHHIDFITAASNLRATNYGIKNADRHNTKFIAGKIIPAIATTTSLVTGLVCLELYKVLDNRRKLEDYKNGFINLALPYFGFSEPVAPKKFKYHETEFTLWDRFDVPRDLTLKELIDYFKSEHELEITMMSCGVVMLYSNFLNKKKMDERLPMKMSEVVELVSKKPIEAHTKSLILEVCANDRDDEDVEVPFIKLQIR